MKIAVLSGKGGAGKTLVSVNLAAVAEKANYVDCDVEEPNGHLFFQALDTISDDIFVSIPSVDEALCIGCRVCVNFCRFNAFAFIQEKPLLFSEVCHFCGGCARLCPQGAIKEVSKKVGTVGKGTSENVTIYGGAMLIGETSGMPVVRDLFSRIENEEGLAVLDCPPGSGCLVMECVKRADFCVLVAEPTLFGAHNLEMIYKLVEIFDKPFGVILNKTVDGTNPSMEFCQKNNISVLGRIPFDYELGERNSNAQIIAREDTRYNKVFHGFLERIMQEVRQ